MSDTQGLCSKCSIHFPSEEVQFGATVKVYLRISNAVACQLKNDLRPNFICKHCSKLAKIDPQETARRGPTPSIETATEPSDFRKKFQDEKKETIWKIYKEIVHWEPVFFTISKNKVGFKITDFMNIFLNGTLAKTCSELTFIRVLLELSYGCLKNKVYS